MYGFKKTTTPVFLKENGVLLFLGGEKRENGSQRGINQKYENPFGHAFLDDRDKRVG